MLLIPKCRRQRYISLILTAFVLSAFSGNLSSAASSILTPAYLQYVISDVSICVFSLLELWCGIKLPNEYSHL